MLSVFIFRSNKPQNVNLFDEIFASYGVFGVFRSTVHQCIRVVMDELIQTTILSTPCASFVMDFHFWFEQKLNIVR